MTLDDSTTRKIASSCQVDLEQVIGVHDMDTIYEVPLLLQDQGFVQRLQKGLELDKLSLPASAISKGSDLWNLWKTTVVVPKDLPPVEIALVGKYTSMMDSYLSVTKALEHAAMRCKRRLKLVPVDSEQLDEDFKKKDPAKYEEAWAMVKKSQGIVVPGGFGSRGIQGMIDCAQWARENKHNYLGICLGMQVATIEASRNLCGRKNATSEEFDVDSKYPDDWAVVFMPESSKE